MRRSDREITDKSEIISIINKCQVCRIAFSDNNMPYVVPINYGHEYVNGKLTLYFHGANEGRKHEIIARNPVACFVIDCSHKLIEAEEAAQYTMEFESVIGSGKISYITDKDEKIHACKLIMKQYVKDKEFSWSDSVLDSVTLFKLDVMEYTGKRLKK